MNLLLLAEDLHRDGNLVEAAWWWLIALAFVYYAWRQRGGARQRCWIAAAVFFLFGASDLIEMQTGAWWKPWWLFAWKAACVLAMPYLVIADYRARRKGAGNCESVNGENAVGDADGDSQQDKTQRGDPE
ncbi:MAG: hypothetical protein JXO22_08420 [Phycisphaerae bacterium]|nr:hypothetical protein [Phycisphaerae bacterium]